METHVTTAFELVMKQMSIICLFYNFFAVAKLSPHLTDPDDQDKIEHVILKWTQTFIKKFMDQSGRNL